jgi:hypothetical protein
MMTCRRCLVIAATAVFAAACGPNARGGDDTGGDDDTGGPDASTCSPSSATETACNDGFDEDCDGYMDCFDVDCIDDEVSCPNSNPNCEVATPTASLSLPDGQCSGTAPIGGTDAQNQAFLMTCSSYEATLDLSGFPDGARLTDTSRFLGVCVNMEHSWLRDLQVEAYCPDGNRVILSRFRGQDCPSGPCEVYLGQANDGDSAQSPVPGTGHDYCWTTAAANPPMIDYVNGQPDVIATYILPAGDYQPSEPFSGFANCSLNGGWRIRVVDGWGIDNGYIFESRLMFDGSLSEDCPIIE